MIKNSTFNAGDSLVLLTGCSDSNDGSPDSGNPSDSVRDVRYCEYLAIEPTAEGIIATAWNSFGLNDCPAQDWDAVNEDDLQRYADELGVRLVTKNGARFG